MINSENKIDNNNNNQDHIGPCSTILATSGDFGPFEAVRVLFWAISRPQWVPKWTHGWANMAYNHVLCP